MNAVIYARYSSDHQREESNMAQIRACREYAALHGYNVLRTYEDEEKSAKNDKRPEFQKLMRASERKEFDTVFVHKYNRFARRISDHVRYEDHLNSFGIQLIAVAEDFGQGKEAIIMKSLMRGLSEYYLVDLSDEVKKGHKENALTAVHNGGVPPFGYDVVGGKYVINELEASYVRRLFDAALDRKGYVSILKEMDAAGIKGKRGMQVRYTQVYEMLHNEKYTGTYVYSPQMPKTRLDRRERADAIRIEGAFDAIISRDLFEGVQRIMCGRKQVGKKASYLCSGLVYCSCGAKMHAITTHKGEHQYSSYYCSKKCGAPMVPVSAVDDSSIAYLHNLLSPESSAEITKALFAYQGMSREREMDYNASKQREISERKRRYDAMLNNLSTGVLPPSVVSDLGQKMAAIKSEIEALKEAPIPQDFTAQQIMGWLESLRNASDEKAIHLLIDRIDIENKADIRISSLVTSVVGDTGWGSRI